MFPPPVVLGFDFCEKVVVEEGTKNVTLVNTMVTLRVDSFPSQPEPFVISVVLTDALGSAMIEFIVTELATNEEAYAYRSMVRFSDRLAQLRVFAHVNDCSFLAPGTYEFALLIDGEWVDQRDLEVIAKEIDS